MCICQENIILNTEYLQLFSLYCSAAQMQYLSWKFGPTIFLHISHYMRLHPVPQTLLWNCLDKCSLSSGLFFSSCTNRASPFISEYLIYIYTIIIESTEIWPCKIQCWVISIFIMWSFFFLAIISFLFLKLKLFSMDVLIHRNTTQQTCIPPWLSS